MHYGARAKAWITDHDIKQKALAKEFHVTEGMFSHYMTGRNDIPVDVLVKFAQHFHITMDYLVGLCDDPEPPFHLSTQEKQMVTQFRTLSREQRELILQNLKLMQEQNSR